MLSIPPIPRKGIQVEEGIFPCTLFFCGYLTFIFGRWFVAENRRKGIYTAALIVSVIALGLLISRGYSSTASLLFCLFALTLIITYGFDINLGGKKTPPGPLGKYVYKEGISQTPLDPKGQVDVEGTTLNAMTEGFFVNKGEAIRVIRASDKVVVVEKLS